MSNGFVELLYGFVTDRLPVDCAVCGGGGDSLSNGFVDVLKGLFGWSFVWGLAAVLRPAPDPKPSEVEVRGDIDLEVRRRLAEQKNYFAP